MQIDKNWLVGFTDGEGCFFVGLNKNKTMRLGIQVLAEFRIIQHKRDIKLLYSIKKFFGCGNVVFNRNKNNPIMEYRVRNVQHLLTIILPFFRKNNLLTNKKFDFEDFCKILFIIEKGEHLTDTGLSQIKLIKSRMNRNRIL